VIEALALGDVIATAGVVVVDGDHVLLVEHGDGAGHITGAWGIPAGEIDGDETARVGAARELAEETGLRVDVQELVELPTLYQARIRRKVGSQRFSLRVFVATRYQGNVTPSAEGVPRWVHANEVAGLRPLLGNTAQIVEAAMQLQRR